MGVALGRRDSNYTPSLLSWGCQGHTSSSATPMACFPSSQHPVGGEKGRPPGGRKVCPWPPGPGEGRRQVCAVVATGERGLAELAASSPHFPSSGSPGP